MFHSGFTRALWIARRNAAFCNAWKPGTRWLVGVHSNKKPKIVKKFQKTWLPVYEPDIWNMTGFDMTGWCQINCHIEGRPGQPGQAESQTALVANCRVSDDIATIFFGGSLIWRHAHIIKTKIEKHLSSRQSPLASTGIVSERVVRNTSRSRDVQRSVYYIDINSS